MQLQAADERRSSSGALVWNQVLTENVKRRASSNVRGEGPAGRSGEVFTRIATGGVPAGGDRKFPEVCGSFRGARQAPLEAATPTRQRRASERRPRIERRSQPRISADGGRRARVQPVDCAELRTEAESRRQPTADTERTRRVRSRKKRDPVQREASAGGRMRWAAWISFGWPDRLRRTRTSRMKWLDQAE